MLLNHFESLFEFIIFMKIDIPHVDKEKWSFEYPFEFMYVYEKKCRPIGRDFMCMCIAWGSHWVCYRESHCNQLVRLHLENQSTAQWHDHRKKEWFLVGVLCGGVMCLTWCYFPDSPDPMSWLTEESEKVPVEPLSSSWRKIHESLTPKRFGVEHDIFHLVVKGSKESHSCQFCLFIFESNKQ